MRRRIGAFSKVRNVFSKQDTLRGRAFRCVNIPILADPQMSLMRAEDSGTVLGIMHLDCVFKQPLTRWIDDASLHTVSLRQGSILSTCSLNSEGQAQSLSPVDDNKLNAGLQAGLG